MLTAIATVLFFVGSGGSGGSGVPPTQQPLTTEKHLSNIRQLTHGGENAEAYFSRDGKRVVFQSTREGVPC
ncbi:MAG: hypothetical protein M3545_18810, partial [Acidobacteriota bacterium]|nr:hypothetical protein [Acidobacteriota bacterium]